MKRQKINGIALVAIAGLTLASCDIWKDVEYTVTPDPLEMHGDSVRVSIVTTIPKKGIHKKAVAEVTPMLGDKAFKTIVIQGEKAPGNGQVIKKEGGKVSYEDMIPYSEDMENAELKVKAMVTKGKKDPEEFVTDKLADGTTITPYLLRNDDKPLIGKDEFVRTTEEQHFAQINYLKGKSNVRSTELRQDDIKDLEAFLTNEKENVKINAKNIEIESYASPEGEVSKNQNLASDRAESGKEAVMGISKKLEFEKGNGEGFYKLNPKGEDWNGFKTAVEASDLEDKELILRVLSMYPDPTKREQEIQNMAKTYKKLEKDILPPLRRSQIHVIYDLTGFSDEELKSLSKSNPDTLTVEELLFTATLTDDLNEKLRLYKEVERLYPNDWRGANNTGYVLFLQNKLGAAKEKFEKANNLKDNPYSKNNLGIVARINGDRNKAKDLLNEAMSAGSEVKYNMGLINIQNGMYDEAITNMGSEKTFNKALAQLLNKDADGSLSTINDSQDNESAYGYYLKAIVGARKGDADMLVNNLKSAVSKDASLKEKASKDREFIKFFDNAAFKSAVQ